MKVVVTGGAGFIGSWLCERLVSRGDDVTIVDNLSSGTRHNIADVLAADCALHAIDVSSPAFAELVRATKPEVIFHLAGQTDIRRSIADPAAEIAAVLGTVNVAEAALRAGTRKIVFTSSSAIYGEADWLPVPENAPQRPISPCGIGKKSAGDYLEYYRNQRGLDFTNLVLGTVYGPRQRAAGGVVSAFASRMLAGQEVVIFGSGRQVRDFVFVDDVVDALLAASTHAGGLRLNIGTGHPTSILEVFERVSALTGYTKHVTHAPPRVGEAKRAVLDSRAAAINMGWRAITPLGTGLQSTLSWVNGPAVRAA